MVWMSLYFTFGVWASISLVYANERWPERGATQSVRLLAVGADR
jgi:hypothetical protein